MLFHEPNPLSRRKFIQSAAGGALAAALSSTSIGASRQLQPEVHFFLIGDTHYLADKEHPDQLDERSKRVTTGLIDTLNRLPGTAIPSEAGGGAVGPALGVIHAGDLIDSGDKAGSTYPKMQQREWDAYVADFGLTGKDGRLHFPVYEIHGNHDGPGGKGIAIDGILRRNKSRSGLANVSPNGLHYSWNWGPVHLVCLGIVVGQVESVPRKRRYNPLKSLDFLVEDLKTHVGDSGRPVVVTHHVDVARNSGPCDPNLPFDNKEWDACDVHAYYETIKPYNVIALFYGHTHVRNVFKWDGASTKAREGIDVFNVAKASHFSNGNQALFYVQVTGDRLTVREYITRDAWATGSWTPQVWTKPIQSGRA